LHKSGHKGFKLTLRSFLPIGGGLGSSASYSTALASTLLIYYNHLNDLESQESLEKVNQWALISEKIIHGNPSGIDNTITVYGGALLYAKGQSKLSPLDS
jgi:mevalonate kinase